MADEVRLKRSLSLPLLVLYGLGTTIGAGIYALTGKVAGGAGMYAPVAFLVASLMAAFSAFSFAEMSSRYPRAAGEAVYVREGLGWPGFAVAVGLLVTLSGSVSAATMANAFAGYFGELTPVPHWLAVTGFALVLGLVAAWGVNESVAFACVITVIEIAGLVWVVWVARGALADAPMRIAELLPPPDVAAWGGILGAALLAFYAFLGFEDMVNMAEEVVDVHATLPVAIILTLVLTTLLYGLVALTAVLAVSPAELGASEAPLALVFERSAGVRGSAISGIAVLAMVNGALIQVIMAARVLYGLASQGSLPGPLARIHPRTRTPLLATAIITGVVAALGLWLPLVELAAATSVITLAVFASVNLALWRVKLRDPNPAQARVFPMWIPIAGFTVSGAFLLLELAGRLGLAPLR